MLSGSAGGRFGAELVLSVLGVALKEVVGAGSSPPWAGARPIASGVRLRFHHFGQHALTLGRGAFGRTRGSGGARIGSGCRSRRVGGNGVSPRLPSETDRTKKLVQYRLQRRLGSRPLVLAGQNVGVEGAVEVAVGHGGRRGNHLELEVQQWASAPAGASGGLSGAEGQPQEAPNLALDPPGAVQVHVGRHGGVAQHEDHGHIVHHTRDPQGLKRRKKHVNSRHLERTATTRRHKHKKAVVL